MTISSRNFKKNRTNRRVRKIPYEGPNKRKGMGRRQSERYTYYACLTILGLISVIIISFMTVLCFNIVVK